MLIPNNNSNKDNNSSLVSSEEYLKLIKIIFTGCESAILNMALSPDETFLYCFFSNRSLISFTLDLTCIFDHI